MGRTFLCWIAFLSLQCAAPTVFAQADCARTPAAAIAAAGTGLLLLPTPAGKGYRVNSVRRDPVLRQSWLMIGRCDHPEWPELSFRETGRTLRGPAAPSGEARSADLPVVRAGDVVQLWRQEDLLRIEVAGVAEENGGLGKVIRVRLRRRNTDDQSAEEQFTGIVRGPADVEMEP